MSNISSDFATDLKIRLKNPRFYSRNEPNLFDLGKINQISQNNFSSNWARIISLNFQYGLFWDPSIKKELGTKRHDKLQSPKIMENIAIRDFYDRGVRIRTFLTVSFGVLHNPNLKFRHFNF